MLTLSLKALISLRAVPLLLNYAVMLMPPIEPLLIGASGAYFDVKRVDASKSTAVESLLKQTI